MKNKTLWIILGVIILVLVIGYFSNWFGLKSKANPVTQSARGIAPVLAGGKLTCPENCVLTTQTTSLSSNVGYNGVLYTCYCSGGITQPPTIA